MSAPFKEIEFVIKEVMKSSKIESSSDFICATYKIYDRYFPNLASRIEPILMIEVSNSEIEWSANAVYSERCMMGLNSIQLYSCMIAYRIVLDFYLNDDMVSKRFIMNEEDDIGWKIFRELDAKYKWCKKRMDIEVYRETNYV